MALTSVQQHLLSFFNLVKVASLKSTIKVFEEVLKNINESKSPSKEDLSKEISIINRTIKNYDLEIAESVDEITCENLFILINTGDNLVTQKSKFYDEHTTQLFSKIMKDCLLSEDRHVSEDHCLNLSSEIGITTTAAQPVLEKLIRDKWLVLLDGSISLGMRSLVELEQSIKDLYPEIIEHCPFCKLIVFQGYVCKNCKQKCHYACLKKYCVISKSNCVCPNCDENWDDASSHFDVENNDDSRDTDFISPDQVPHKRKKKQ